MGCDIHGVWQTKNAKNEWEDVEDIDDNRNYRLFSILADVRNPGTITPICEPKGLPEDVFCSCKPPKDYMGYGSYCECNKIEDSYERERKYGDHSYSWLLASEIDKYLIDNPTIQLNYVVNREDYDKPNKDPDDPYDSWCGSISGPGIVVGKEIDGKVVPDNATHVDCIWSVKTTIAMYAFYEQFVRLKEEYKDLRLVFGFDN